MNSQFARLGVQGDFANPYLTLRPEFEARQVEIFGEMAKKGYIYKGMKPFTGARRIVLLWQKPKSSMPRTSAILSMSALSSPMTPTVFWPSMVSLWTRHGS